MSFIADLERGLNELHLLKLFQVGNCEYLCLPGDWGPKALKCQELLTKRLQRPHNRRRSETSNQYARACGNKRRKQLPIAAVWRSLRSLRFPGAGRRCVAEPPERMGQGLGSRHDGADQHLRLGGSYRGGAASSIGT